MKLLQKILIATDFSSSSDSVFQRALEIAGVFKSEIFLLHAIPDLKEEIFSLDEVKNMATEKLRKYEDIAKSKGVKLSDVRVETGEPFKRIIHHSNANDVNVIIIGAGGKNEKGDYNLGITAERLLRRSTKPVWMIKGDIQLEYKNILCPIDNSKHSQRILKNAVHLARQLKAELTVMHVIKPLSSVFSLFSENILASKQKKYNDGQTAKFESFLKEIDFHGITWKKIIKQGRPSHEILDIINKNATDLLIMGALGVTSDPDVSIGRVAEKVVHVLPCSIILIKQEEPIQVRLDRELKNNEDHIKLGWEFLGNGMPEKALFHFERCISKHIFYLPAWKGIVAAHERLGNKEAVEESKKKIKDIEQKNWQTKVEAEVRRGFIDKIKGKK